ncbi:N-acetyltransferase [Acrasis kona]|uniref:N-acetyltransferase n=1 Tax=Acrasis kona TaxID=1008807 RepID=A0AAW2YII7_9EUKA
MMDNQSRSASVKNKCIQIKNIVDDWIGIYQSDDEFSKKQYKLFVYVDETFKVLGCLVAERTSTAQQFAYNEENGTRQLLITDKEKKVVMGISRIFVDLEHRRKGIATTLLESARKHMIYGYHCNKNRLAFSHPTSMGHEFAKHYMQKHNYLVY